MTTSIRHLRDHGCAAVKGAVLLPIAIFAIGCVSNQSPGPTNGTRVAFRQLVERQIQQCIHEKTASPNLCRASAYSATLAAGFSKDDAVYWTGYEPE